MKRTTSQNVLLEHVHKKEDMALWCANHVNAGDLKLLLDDYATTYTRKQFQFFLRRVHSAVMYLADATSTNSLRHHLTAVNVIDTLIDIVESENSEMLILFASVLSSIAKQPKQDPRVLDAFEKALGHLLRVNSSVTASFVAAETQIARQTLVKKDDERILAAVKLIHVMAKDAPAEFNAQLESFLKSQNHGDDIPPLAVALFHSDIVVRRAASVALASCFDLAREMNNIKQQRWTHYMWEASQIYLSPKYARGSSNVQLLHGALLILDVLVCNVKLFNLSLKAYFRQICNAVTGLLLASDRQPVIQHLVLTLIPNIVRCNPDRFVRDEWSSQWLAYLLKLIKAERKNERAWAFMAFGELFEIGHGVDTVLAQSVSDVVTQVAEVFRKKESAETQRAALDCMTRLASVESAYGAITRIILENNLLGTLFSIGLTSELMKTMTVLQKNLSPHIKTMVEEHVLEEISEILVGIPFHATSNGEHDKSGDDKRSPRNHGRLRSKSSHRQMKFVHKTSQNFLSAIRVRQTKVNAQELVLREGRSRKDVVLALRALRTFDFVSRYGKKRVARNQRLNAIFSSAMWIYMPMYFEHFADEVRAEAFETCVFILELLAEDSVGSRESKRGDDMIVVDNVFLQILERVVEVALTDSAVENRQHMLERLGETPLWLIRNLARPRTLRLISVALNDEDYDVRSAALTVFNRLAQFRPLWIVPELSAMLASLVASLQFVLDDSRYQMEAMTLLAKLLRVQQPSNLFLGTKIDIVLDVLLPKITLNSSTQIKNPRVLAAAFQAVAALADKAHAMLCPYVHDLMPPILRALQISDRPDIQCAATQALGSVISATGLVGTKCFRAYSEQLPLLVRLLRQQFRDDRASQEAMRAVGLLGAIDIGEVKQSKIWSRVNGILRPRVVQQQQQSSNEEKTQTSSSSEEEEESAYSTRVVYELVRILSMPSKSLHHEKAVKACIRLMRLAGGSSINRLLPVVVPGLLRILESQSEPKHRVEWEARVAKISYQALSVAFCMGHAQLFRSENDYTRKVLELVKRSLLQNDRVVLSETLVLAEDLAILMQSKFIPHLTKLLDPLLWSLQKDAELLDPVLRSLQQDNTAAMSVPLADVKEFILLKLEALPVLCQFAESHVLNLVLPPLVQMVKQISLPIVVRRMAVITLSRFNRMFDLAEWTALVLPPLCQVLTKMTVPQYPRLPGETSADLAEIDLWAHLISLLKSFIIKVGGQQPSTVRMLRRTLAATLRPWNQSAIAAIQSVRKFQDQDMSRSLSKLVERQSVRLAAFEAENSSRWPDNRDGNEKTEDEVKDTLLHLWFEHPKIPQNKHSSRAQHEKDRHGQEWIEWLRRLALEQLRLSPSPSLHACYFLAMEVPSLAEELFIYAFSSLWKKFQSKESSFAQKLMDILHADILHDCVDDIKSMGIGGDLMATNRDTVSSFVPARVLRRVLLIFEFMEREAANDVTDGAGSTSDGRQMHGLGMLSLGMLAHRCGSLSTAVYCFEKSFRAWPKCTVTRSRADFLIGIMGKLIEAYQGVGMHHAAIGFYNTALRLFPEIEESPRMVNLHEILGDWQKALDSYGGGPLETPAVFDSSISSKKDDRKLSKSVAIRRIRCLDKMWKWEELYDIALKHFGTLESISSDAEATEIAPPMARAAIELGKWEQCGEELPYYVKAIPEVMPQRAFFEACFWAQCANRSVSDPSQSECTQSQIAKGMSRIRIARHQMNDDLASKLRDGYSTSYSNLVYLQQLSELEELFRLLEIQASTDAPVSSEERAKMRRAWHERIMSCQRNVDAWQRLLLVRIIEAGEPKRVDVRTWLKFSSICLRHGRGDLSLKALKVLGINDRSVARRPEHAVRYAYAKHLWKESQGGNVVAIQHLESLLSDIKLKISTTQSNEIRNLSVRTHIKLCKWKLMLAAKRLSMKDNNEVELSSPSILNIKRNSQRRSSMKRLSVTSLSSRSTNVFQWHELTDGRSYGRSRFLSAHNTMKESLHHAERAKDLDPSSQKAWSLLSLISFELVQLYEDNKTAINLESKMKRAKKEEPMLNGEEAVRLASLALTGFFRSITLSTPASEESSGNEDEVMEYSNNNNTSTASHLQELIRLLTIWFAYGNNKSVDEAFKRGVYTVPVYTWLGVVPQLLARLHLVRNHVRVQLMELLSRIGSESPQALIFPLTVACKSPLKSRQITASTILESTRREWPTLVEHAELVSAECVRVAVLWEEQWHGALEEAWRQHYHEKNPEGAVEVLMPLHKKVECPGPQTGQEAAFEHRYGEILRRAFKSLNEYMSTKDTQYLHQAWGLYYRLFAQLNTALGNASSVIKLHDAAPRLVHCQDLEIAVPGTYRARSPIVRIAKFNPSMQVISSKQRPRKITLYGSNGVKYGFLLKGHEDLRQDERVMQLFGLVNELLAQHKNNAEVDVSRVDDLTLQRYAVVPLTENIGVIGWVEGCDTLHSLVSGYRGPRHIPDMLELSLMQAAAPAKVPPENFNIVYHRLTSLQKQEVFRFARDNTSGDDLAKSMWLSSSDSESWLDRRTLYTRSLALMSVVGYMLGLGDRHPSNIMLQRSTGKVVHIDFGDCWEVAQMRDLYPEKVPFRLTRMLVNAMEVGGIDGTFRSTCELVLGVLRQNRSSVMAMLETFVYDPLINWRLLPEDSNKTQSRRRGSSKTGNEEEKSKNDDDIGVPSDVAQNMENAIQIKRNKTAQFVGSVRKSIKTRRKSSLFLLSSVGRTEEDEVGTSVKSERLTESAENAIRRVEAKLHGRDFTGTMSKIGPQSRRRREEEDNSTMPMAVTDQIDFLIEQATSLENLSEAYIGWCPFW